MLAHPTDPALPPFYIGTAISKPTMIINGSTVHVVLGHDDATLAEVGAALENALPSRSYLLIESDIELDETLALHWYSERKNADGHRYVLQLVDLIENVRAEFNGHSESSIGVCTEHLLADSELAHFGLTTGSLLFEGTRTVQVWRAHPALSGAATPVTRLFLDTGVHCYHWMHAAQAHVEGRFPTLDGDPRTASW